MDADRFESFLRSLSASPSRRSALRLLTGLILGSSLALGVAEADAHNKLKKCKKIEDKDKRKRCVKKAKQHKAQHAPQPPVPVLTYQCPEPRETAIHSGVNQRFAQTFTAAQSGSLLQIQFEIIKEAGSTGDWVVELLAAAGGVPTNTVLAEDTIPNASVPDGPSTLTASFAGPPLVAGTEYAAALSRPGASLMLGGRAGDDCTGIAFFQDSIETEPFQEVAAGIDLVVSVTVLA